MKITKKMRKKANGMSAATKRDFEVGYTPPTFSIMSGEFVVIKGTTYVNELNFR